MIRLLIISFSIILMLSIPFFQQRQFEVGMIVIGIGFLIVIVLLLSSFEQPERYAFMLSLNSGKEIYFLSKDKSFLNKLVSTMYGFMEEGIDSYVFIDMSNRSIKVGGNFHGNANTGDSSEIR